MSLLKTKKIPQRTAYLFVGLLGVWPILFSPGGCAVKVSKAAAILAGLEVGQGAARQRVPPLPKLHCHLVSGHVLAHFHLQRGRVVTHPSALQFTRPLGGRCDSSQAP